MSAVVRPTPQIFDGLRRRALSLGAANAFEAAMQFLLPVALARALDAATFGEYRLLWLAVGTVMALCMLGMPQGLFYFLPRAHARLRRLYVHQTLIYVAVVGLLVGLFMSPWNPWLPATLAPLMAYGPLVPTFIALWVAASVLDVLPTVEERIGWQIGANMTLSLLRASTLAVAAFASGDLGVLLALLVALVLLKIAILMAYVGRFHGFGGRWAARATFREQVRNSVPFGISSSLFGLRIQLDQWVAASLFALSSFAAFSVAALLSPLVTLFRASVNDAFLPNMCRHQAANDLQGMMALNGRANVLVATFVCPILAMAFAFAEEIVTVVYTAAYVEAAAVMRVYIVGLSAGLVEVGSILLLLKLGGFALRMNAVALALCLLVGIAAAQRYGLPGAALGSVVAIWFDRILTLRRIARATGLAIGALQEWRLLALLVTAAVLAAAVAAIGTQALLPQGAPLARLMLGGALLAVTYGVLVGPRYLPALRARRTT